MTVMQLDAVLAIEQAVDQRVAGVHLLDVLPVHEVLEERLEAFGHLHRGHTRAPQPDRPSHREAVLDHVGVPAAVGVDDLRGSPSLLVLDRLAVGENTGNVVPSLKQVAVAYQKNISNQLNMFTKVIASAVLLGVFAGRWIRSERPPAERADPRDDRGDVFLRDFFAKQRAGLLHLGEPRRLRPTGHAPHTLRMAPAAGRRSCSRPPRRAGCRARRPRARVALARTSALAARADPRGSPGPA